jgi:uncharacterized membrane protein
MPALHLSFKACLRNFGPLLNFSMIMSLASLLAIIPLLLGFFIVLPLGPIASYLAYKDIFVDKMNAIQLK